MYKKEERIHSSGEGDIKKYGREILNIMDEETVGKTFCHMWAWKQWKIEID